MTAAELICKPFTVCGGYQVTAEQIANAIDRLANLPAQFRASDLAAEILPDAKGWDKQEASNRLFQRWRKLGLVEFKRGRWSLTKGAWDEMQTAALRARDTDRMAKTGTGFVRSIGSPVAESDAPISDRSGNP